MMKPWRRLTDCKNYVLSDFPFTKANDAEMKLIFFLSSFYLVAEVWVSFSMFAWSNHSAPRIKTMSGCTIWWYGSYEWVRSHGESLTSYSKISNENHRIVGWNFPENIVLWREVTKNERRKIKICNNMWMFRDKVVPSFLLSLIPPCPPKRSLSVLFTYGSTFPCIGCLSKSKR